MNDSPTGSIEHRTSLVTQRVLPRVLEIQDRFHKAPSLIGVVVVEDSYPSVRIRLRGWAAKKDGTASKNAVELRPWGEDIAGLPEEVHEVVKDHTKCRMALDEFMDRFGSF